MPHMPATGVSGLDLYVESSSENPVWYAGSYHFGDTITYSYTDLHSRYGSGEKPHTYKVYLPLYNGVKWMEIGIPEENNFYTADPAEKKPRSEEHTSELQSRGHLVCRLLLEK